MRGGWVALLGALLVVSGRGAWAWDHRDGTLAPLEPGADITDLYAWMSPDGARLHLILNVEQDATPDARFPNGVQYLFHTASRAAPAAAEGPHPVTVLCAFDDAQAISCWVGDLFLSGDASVPGGLASPDGSLRVFAGVRNDPFFMNRQGWEVFATTVHRGNRAGYTWDGAHCPTFLPDRARLGSIELKQSDDRGSGGFDYYASRNVLSIVLSVDKRLLTRDGPIVSVWASTNRRP